MRTRTKANGGLTVFLTPGEVNRLAAQLLAGRWNDNPPTVDALISALEAAQDAGRKVAR